MIPKLNRNLKAAVLIAAIFILAILLFKNVYLPETLKDTLSYYHKWINNIDESVNSEVDFIIRSQDYKINNRYKIHGVEVERIRKERTDKIDKSFNPEINFIFKSPDNQGDADILPNTVTIERERENKKEHVSNNFILAENVKFSLSKVINNVYSGLHEANHIALIAGNEIIWSSWKLAPSTKTVLFRLTDSAHIQKNKMLPDRINIDGESYYLFAISNRIAGVKPVKLIGLVSVKDFNQKASTLPIRRISYLVTFLLFIILLLPLFKMCFITKSEGLKPGDYRFVLTSVVLISFLSGAIWGLYSYKERDKKLFESRLSESTSNIINYFENQLTYTITLLNSSKSLLKRHKYGYFKENFNQNDSLDITSLYLMNNEGMEVSNWSKRNTINMGRYDHREYFKAFNEKGFDTYHVTKFNDSTKILKPLEVYYSNNLKARPKNKWVPYKTIQPSFTELNDSSSFYLQTIASLLDGTVKNVVSMPYQKNTGEVMACSFNMKKMLAIIHPPGYNYAVFDRNGKVYFHSNINEVSANNLFYFFQHTDDFLWKLSHKEKFFDKYKIRGIDSYCSVEEITCFPGFFVMTYYSIPNREEARGQAWIKLLFVFTLLLILCFILIFHLKLKKWCLIHWVLVPIKMSIAGALLTLFLYQYEIKQLEAWTLDESNYSISRKSESFLPFQISESYDTSKIQFKKLPYFWNRLHFPQSISNEAIKYRRLVKELNDGAVRSHRNYVAIANQRVELAKIAELNHTLPFLGIVSILLLISIWLRHFFVIPYSIRKIAVKKQQLSEEQFKGIWNDLSLSERYILFDIADDDTANLSNREALKKLYDLGLVEQKERTCKPVLNSSIEPILEKKLQQIEEKNILKQRQGFRQKYELIGIMVLFGVIVMLSIVSENWLNSFIGIITLITAGLGTARKLLNEISTLPKKKNDKKAPE